MSNWLKHVEEWQDCQRCPLAQQRSRVCLARGTLPADVVFIGEAPGISEDTLGLPFVGPAGLLLDKIIERALLPGMTHVMTNLVACFPREAKSRGDNEPERGEILECRPRLVEFVNIAQPRLIVFVGKLAKTYARLSVTMPSVDIYHPSFILSKMPQAQQHMEVQKSIVIIRNALEDLVQLGEKSEWQLWGASDAEVKTSRSGLRDIYRAAEQGDDSIPF